MTERKILTSRFGELKISKEKVLSFPQGIVGFPKCHQFTVIEYQAPFSWLQSLDDPDLAFVVVDGQKLAFQYPYQASLSEVIDLQKKDPYLILTLIVIRESLRDATVNLKAPIYINLRNNQGFQLILDEEKLATKANLWDSLTK